MNETWLIPGLVFAAAVLAVEALYWMIFQGRGAKKAVNRRLALSQKLANPTQVFDVLRQERGFAGFNNAALAGMNDFLVQTGLRLSKSALLLWTGLVGVALSALATPLLGFHLISLAVGVVVAPLLVALYLRIVRAKRIARFAGQLPDAIDIIVRGLRIGHPFASAVELVSRELADPIGSEFGMTADEISFGQDVTAAVNNLYRRVGQDDLLFLVIAVSVQSQTGGNLAEILARLSRLVRDRARMRLKIKALSAEGRMSGYFLTAMPFLLYLVIQLIAPNYFKELRGHPALIPALIYGWTSLIIGNYAIYRMVNFKV